MKHIISPRWQDRIADLLNKGAIIDETTAYRPAVQWLIVELSHRQVPFRQYSLGAGVYRITTVTDKCPCCKKPV